MILIADSGSTKTSWALVAGSGKYSTFETAGINPFFMSVDAIERSVSDELLPQLAPHWWIGPITAIYFYGAGCTPEKSPLVGEALQQVFKKAERIEVESDMLGAARALFGRERGIACILGTGSNSSLWNGEGFEQSVPALGFILGDEGSGAVLGKRLVADLLKNQLGEELRQEFLEQYETTQAEIIDRVYRQPFPNRYLAQFARFAADRMGDARIAGLVREHFRLFVTRNLLQYPRLPIGFVGSVAYYFRDVLVEVLGEYGLEVRSVLRSPLEGLIRYHQFLF